jgi:hypothetical protein
MFWARFYRPSLFAGPDVITKNSNFVNLEVFCCFSVYVWGKIVSTTPIPTPNPYF